MDLAKGKEKIRRTIPNTSKLKNLSPQQILVALEKFGVTPEHTYTENKNLLRTYLIDNGKVEPSKVEDFQVEAVSYEQLFWMWKDEKTRCEDLEAEKKQLLGLSDAKNHEGQLTNEKLGKVMMEIAALRGENAGLKEYRQQCDDLKSRIATLSEQLQQEEARLTEANAQLMLLREKEAKWTESETAFNTIKALEVKLGDRDSELQQLKEQLAVKTEKEMQLVRAVKENVPVESEAEKTEVKTCRLEAKTSVIEPRDVTRVERNKSEFRCWNCGGRNHIQRNCWWRQSDRRMERPFTAAGQHRVVNQNAHGKSCYYCGKLGHLVKDCFSLKRTEGCFDRPGVEAQLDRGRRCWTCGSFDHLRRGCDAGNGPWVPRRFGKGTGLHTPRRRLNVPDLNGASAAGNDKSDDGRQPKSGEQSLVKLDDKIVAQQLKPGTV